MSNKSKGKVSNKSKGSADGAQNNGSHDEALKIYRLVAKGIERDSVSLQSDEVTDSQIKDASDRREANARNRKLEAEADKLVGENNIRKTVATWSLRFVGLQIIVCDALISAYILSNLLGELLFHLRSYLVFWVRVLSRLLESYGLLLEVCFPFTMRIGISLKKRTALRGGELFVFDYAS